MATDTVNQVVYCFTVEEIRHIQRLEAQRHVKWHHNAASFAIFLGSPVIAFFAAYAYFGEERIYAAIAAGIGGYLGPFGYWLLGLAMRPVTNPLKKVKDERELTFFRCTLAKDGLLLETPYSAGMHYWHSVVDVKAEEGFIRVLIEGIARSSISIPVRAFKSTDDANSFARMAHSIWSQSKDARASDKNLDQPQKSENPEMHEDDQGPKILH